MHNELRERALAAPGQDLGRNITCSSAADSGLAMGLQRPQLAPDLQIINQRLLHMPLTFWFPLRALGFFLTDNTKFSLRSAIPYPRGPPCFSIPTTCFPRVDCYTTSPAFT